MTCKILDYTCPCCLASGECVATFAERCDHKIYEEEDVQALMDLADFVMKRIKDKIINE